MTARLLTVVLAVEAALLVLGLAVLVGHAVWTYGRRRRYGAAVHAARQLVRTAVIDDAAGAAAAAALAALPSAVALPLLLDLAVSVGGDGLTRLRAVAVQAGLTARAQSWCGSRRWWRRLRGLRLLARLGDTGDLLPRLLHDPHPAVRAAAAAAAPDVSPGAVPDAVIARLLQLLADPDPQCRFWAMAALLRCGPAVTRRLRRHLDDVAADRAAGGAAALRVAVAVPDPGFLPAALALGRHPDPAVRRGAADLLARLGGQQAAETLTRLMGDPDAGVRAVAAAGLGLLGHWPAAPALADALADPSWEVRRAAALSLRRLGPPGRLYLRRAVAGADAFAADISRQVLQLPDSAARVVAG